MATNKDCILYLDDIKAQLIEEFPTNKELTEKIFLMVYNFVCTDFNGVSENKIFRIFLNTFKDVIEFSFQNDASKSYIRTIFKKLNNKKFLDYLSVYMPAKSTAIKFIMDRFVNFFVYQQDLSISKEYRLKEIVNFVNEYI